MMTIVFWIAAVILVLTAVLALDLMIGNRAVRSLREVPPMPPGTVPRVSIIVAARNEERKIEEALDSLLRLSYSDYELILVNDRSDDRTGFLIDGIADAENRVRAIHIDLLPSGWLGKNHALWVGAKRATGELLLFTDADIVMEPTVLSRAVALLEADSLHHLAATPSVRMPNTFLAVFGASFLIYFSQFSRPWKARDPRSRRHIGIGAFNLVRSEAYWQVGGHEPIRLRPDDDLKLGKLIKLAGLRQDVVYAPEFLCVEWYASVGEVVMGLEKNAFAAADYNVALVLAGALFYSLCNIWPFVAVFVVRGAAGWMYLATVTVILSMVADSTRFHRSRPWYALGYPLASVLFVYILLRTMILNLTRKGIYWRGTFYPLAELKRNRI